MRKRKHVLLVNSRIGLMKCHKCFTLWLARDYKRTEGAWKCPKCER